MKIYVDEYKRMKDVLIAIIVLLDEKVKGGKGSEITSDEIFKIKYMERYAHIDIIQDIMKLGDEGVIGVRESDDGLPSVAIDTLDYPDFSEFRYCIKFFREEMEILMSYRFQ